jgi:hypothetical protein
MVFVPQMSKTPRISVIFYRNMVLNFKANVLTSLSKFILPVFVLLFPIEKD